MTVTRPLLRWHGGKWRIAPKIIGIIPPHKTYIEPFGGAASVLLRKPRAKLEVWNDLDGELVNLFRVLRDDAPALAERVALTPFARAEFEADTPPDKLGRAAWFLVRSHMGHGSVHPFRSTGFRAAGWRSGTLPVHGWMDMPEVVRDVAERMRGVVIESRPAVRVMRDHDEPGAVIYIDPPYPKSTRGDAGDDYAHEMTDDEHAEMLDTVTALSGRVILSGYACDLYDHALRDWQRCEIDARADGGRARKEVLWWNFDATGGLFETPQQDIAS